MARIAKSTMKLPAFTQAAREAGEEVYSDTPTPVVKSGKTGKEKLAMMRAIILSKADQKMKKGK